MSNSGPNQRAKGRAQLEAALQKLWFSPEPGLLLRLTALVLTPLSWLTAWVASRRRARINARRRNNNSQQPTVVIIGNLIAGGAGKTPISLALAEFLSSRGWRVGLICRGGPASAASAQIVRTGLDPLAPSAQEAGDEALLLANASGLPVATGHRRADALALLCQQHPNLQIVLSDDGLQHEALRRSLEIVVMDKRMTGNGQLLPAGPLREPASALDTADAIVINQGFNGSPTPELSTTTPVFGSRLSVRDVIPLRDYLNERDDNETSPPGPARMAPEPNPLAGLKHAKLAAVAGIASPESFFGLLEAHGLQITRYAPGDHAPINNQWIDSLTEDAVIMTEKDAVKCSGSTRPNAWVLRISASPEPALFDWLTEQLEPLRRNQYGSTHS